MKSKFKIIIIISFVLTILCPILYSVKGSRILENGVLDEPFYLVGLMWLFFFVFIVSLIIYVIKKKNW